MCRIALHQCALMPKIVFFYLHGFASGPSSAKAKLFSEKLAELGAQVLVPDLNQPRFEEMTISSQLHVIDSAALSLNSTTELVIVGSSMGGLLATIYAQKSARVRALILLAPGFELLDRWKQWLGDGGLAKWQNDGAMPIYHHSYERELPLSYRLFEDAHAFDTSNLRVNVPTLLFHGKRDTVVPLASSLRFQNRNPESVHLIELKDDHQLLRSTKQIWSTSKVFLQENSLLKLP
jgi:uncharacterized protein